MMMVKNLTNRYERAMLVQKELRASNQQLKYELEEMKQLLKIKPKAVEQVVEEKEYKSVNRISKQGWVYKEGSVVRNWKKRWFVLWDDRIDYYSRREDAEPKGTIQLETCEISPVMARAGVERDCLELLMKKRKWHFVAETNDENEQWFWVIKNRIITRSYLHRCNMCQQNPDTRVLAFLNLMVTTHHLFSPTAILGSISKLPNFSLSTTPARLAVTHQPLTLDTVSVISRMVCEAGLVCAPISVLSFEASNLSSVEVDVISNALCTNHTISELDLSHNHITLDAAQSLARALSENRTLKLLKLDHTQLNDAALSVLASALPNSCLETLVLSHNQIGGPGAAALAQALSSPSLTDTLKCILLDHNNLGDEGAAELASMLLHNSYLHSLDLQHNNINTQGALAISNALQENDSLLELNLLGNPLPHEAVLALTHACRRNRALEKICFAQYTLLHESLAVLRLSHLYGQNVMPDTAPAAQS
eukprot:TRINITY_DN11291_c0_g1_i2.p1 TRINITY_DN11291_c0_g1~~TRINITY_DN11291_c0_g1_i2.p1  ORF type:complete len:479 (-),score=81.73 TRINITY_DN11291_c0_g1_i2:116-1552(-)